MKLLKSLDAQVVIVTALAIIAGLIAGKIVSQQLARFGVPIAAGDPVPEPKK